MTQHLSTGPYWALIKGRSVNPSAINIRMSHTIGRNPHLHSTTWYNPKITIIVAWSLKSQNKKVVSKYLVHLSSLLKKVDNPLSLNFNVFYHMKSPFDMGEGPSSTIASKFSKCRGSEGCHHAVALWPVRKVLLREIQKQRSHGKIHTRI